MTSTQPKNPVGRPRGEASTTSTCACHSRWWRNSTATLTGSKRIQASLSIGEQLYAEHSKSI